MSIGKNGGFAEDSETVEEAQLVFLISMGAAGIVSSQANNVQAKDLERIEKVEAHGCLCLSYLDPVFMKHKENSTCGGIRRKEALGVARLA